MTSNNHNNPFQRALERERRTYDALDRAIELISRYHTDPVETVHLIRTLSNIDRRKL
jgi:hypothetical protein